MTLEEFANEKFNGDIDAALKCLAHENYTDEHSSLPKEIAHNITRKLPRNQAEKYMEFFGQEIEKKPEIIERAVDQSVKLSYLNLEYEQVKNSTSNPFTKRILISLGICLIGLIIFVILALFNMAKAGGITFTVFAAFSGAGLADNIVKSIYFKKLKKQIEKESKE